MLKMPNGHREDFNPRAYVRHDGIVLLICFLHSFQSTCLREARHRLKESYRGLKYFNPRAYVRHDYHDIPGVPYWEISIHVPT